MVDMGKWRKDRIKRGMILSEKKVAKDHPKGKSGAKRGRMIRLPPQETNALIEQAIQGIRRMKRMIRIDTDKKGGVRLPYDEINKPFEQVSQAVRQMRRMIRPEIQRS